MSFKIGDPAEVEVGRPGNGVAETDWHPCLVVAFSSALAGERYDRLDVRVTAGALAGRLFMGCARKCVRPQTQK